MEMTINGKKVNFGKKGRIKWEPLSETGDLTVYLANGKSLVFEMALLPESIKAFAARHGVKQKLGDCCASNDTADQDEESILEMWGQLTGGGWNAGTRDTLGTLVQALMEIFNKTEEDIRATLKEMKAPDIRALKLTKKVREKMAEIEEKSIAPIDDAKLEEMFK